MDIVDNRSLEDVSETAPYKWNGGNPDLETECGPRTERFFFRSQGYNRQELGDLVAYIKSIPLRPNRYRLPDGELTPAQERGKAIFDRTVTHRRHSDSRDRPVRVLPFRAVLHEHKSHDVGSGKSTDRSPMVDTPQLTNVVDMRAVSARRLGATRWKKSGLFSIPTTPTASPTI